jgi:hypothetical protein
MSANEYEQFAKAFRCTVPMAESIVARIRQRVGRDVPMGEILGAIKKIAPTRLTTDSIVQRLQKNSSARSNRNSRIDEEDDFEPEADEDTPAVKPAKRVVRHATSPQGQISEILERNWTRAIEAGLRPPDLSTDKFVRAAQSAVGEPKPTVARVLAAVQKLSKRDVLITPNLVADEIIEADELR